MTKIPSKNDPSADWPEDVKQAYEHLKIPSVYDAVMANEKLSLEIRRQDRELKTIAEGIEMLSAQFTTLLQVLQDEYERDYDEDEDDEDGEDDDHDLGRSQNDFEAALSEALKDEEFLKEHQSYLKIEVQETLMATYDDMHKLSHTSRQMVQQLLELLPKKVGFIPRVPSWRPVVEGIFQSLVETIEQSRYKLLGEMEELDLEVVNPRPGEAFNKNLHHIVDYISGGKSGTIAHVFRVGYRQDKEILRFAEVTVYS